MQLIPSLPYRCRIVMMLGKIMTGMPNAMKRVPMVNRLVPKPKRKLRKPLIRSPIHSCYNILPQNITPLFYLPSKYAAKNLKFPLRNSLFLYISNYIFFTNPHYKKVKLNLKEICLK
jgi:hypothetical protein